MLFSDKLQFRATFLSSLTFFLSFSFFLRSLFAMMTPTRKVSKTGSFLLGLSGGRAKR